MEFFQTIKQIGVFMICAQVILHFKPSAKYEKYLKLLISVMVLVQILIPIVNVFSGKSSSDFYMRVEEIQTEIDKSMEQLEIENAINEENILKQTLEEIKSRINNMLSEEELQVITVEYDEKGGDEMLVLYVDERQSMQNISIQVENINVSEQAVMGKVVTADSIENNNKLHALRKMAATELEILEEQIEVVWNE